MLCSLLTPQQCLNTQDWITYYSTLLAFLPVYTLNIRAQAFTNNSQTSFSYFSHSNILFRMSSKDTQVRSRKCPPLLSCSASHISSLSKPTTSSHSITTWYPAAMKSLLMQANENRENLLFVWHNMKENLWFQDREEILVKEDDRMEKKPSMIWTIAPSQV